MHGIFRDAGISGAKGRDQRPGLDAMLLGTIEQEVGATTVHEICDKCGHRNGMAEEPAGVHGFRHELTDIGGVRWRILGCRVAHRYRKVSGPSGAGLSEDPAFVAASWRKKAQL